MVRHSQMILRIIGATLIGLTASGCAYLDVQVSSMNPKTFRDIQATIHDEELVRQAARSDSSQLQIALTEMCTVYQNGRARLYKLQETYQQSLFNTESDPTRKSGLDGAIKGSQIQQRAIASENVRTGCISATEESDLVNRFIYIGAAPAPDKVVLAIGQYRHSLDQHRQKLSNDLAVLSNATTVKALALEAQLEQKAKADQAVANANSGLTQAETRAAVTGYLGAHGRSLALSDLAHAAAAVENKTAWTPKFNLVHGFGIGGSTDMVVKLDDTADFTMKGLVFDARAAAAAVRKVTLSAVQVLASSSGMPIKTPDPTPGQPDLSIKTDAVTSAKSRIAAAGQDEANYRASIQTVAAAFIAAAEEAGREKPDAAKIKAARERAKKTFDAFSPSLSAPASEDTD